MMKKSILSLFGIFVFVTGLYSQESNGTSSGAKHYVGEKYLGGIIFYIDKTGQHGILAGEKDLPMADWDYANKECSAEGEGWRLPSKDELKMLYNNKDIVGGFVKGYYWSSTVIGFDALLEDFDFGEQYKASAQSFQDSAHVRCVRAF